MRTYTVTRNGESYGTHAEGLDGLGKISGETLAKGYDSDSAALLIEAAKVLPAEKVSGLVEVAEGLSSAEKGKLFRTMVDFDGEIV